MGSVFALDLNHFAPIRGVQLFSGCDFTKPENVDKLKMAIGDRPVSAVISDMAPNASGVRELDKTVIFQLDQQAMHFASQVLGKNGSFLCKFWDDPEICSVLKSKALEYGFTFAKIIKPNACRDDSSELFMFASNFQKGKSES